MPSRTRSSARSFGRGRIRSGDLMARTRSIRPGFFKNETLCSLSPLTRLLFAGLWTMADRDGRLLDRPQKLKAELFPYDHFSVERALVRLEALGFIQRYSNERLAAIQIVNWDKHQRPHPNEEESKIPSPPKAEPSSNGLTPEDTPEEHQMYQSRLTSNPPSSSSSSSSSFPSYSSLRENPPSPLPEFDPGGAETCPECDMPVDRNGQGHGLTRGADRVRNCSLDHQAPWEWQRELASP